ncbi:MAG: hypothetical protein ABGY24_15555 [bacterium]
MDDRRWMMDDGHACGPIIIVGTRWNRSIRVGSANNRKSDE